MNLVYYGALLLAQAGTTAKQFAMKKCGKHAPGAFNSVSINLARSLICFVVSTIIWLCMGGGTTTFSGHVIIILSGIGTAFNLFSWILSSQIVSLTLIESISMIGSMVIPLLLAPYLYNGDSVSSAQWLGCILVFVSVWFFMNKKTTHEEKAGSALQKIIVVGICAVSTTLTAVLKKYYTYHITANNLGSIEYFTFISFLTVLVVFSVMFAVYYMLEKKRAATNVTADNSHRVELPYKKVWIYILIAGVALYVNELFTSHAAQLPSAIYYPLSRGLVVGCTFLLDVIVFKDRITPKKIVGFFVVIAAIILINL